MKTLRGSISESAKAEVPPRTPPSWPRGFGVGIDVGDEKCIKRQGMHKRRIPCLFCVNHGTK